ncbi:MAG TPA: type IV secretory system conjugative DNA transfer family protein [Streptosporangiaceae bacterium]|nr:type IV secretory system conjugative DNA transfer family protein [Streptosporangiaceae bacterium]
MKIIILIAVVLVLLLFIKWAFLPWFPYRRLPHHRTRHMRLRLHLRLHPGPGHATVVELWLRWGRLACFRRSGRARRSMPFWERVLASTREYSILVGRGHYRHALRLPLEEHAVVKSPPRGGKTGWLASVILHYPGPVISTTTKHDVFELTSGIRARRGPVHVFNPQGVGNVPSTFRWNPLEGCEDPATAIRRADAFASSVTQKGVEDATFWASKASDYLRAYFHAAALANLDLRHVARWVTSGPSTEAERILIDLAEPGGHQWAAQLAELRGEANKTAQTIKMTMSRALAFLADPALAAAVVPVPGHSLNLERFLRERGTLYLIAESRGEDAPVAPLFACLASELHYTAALLGSRMPGGRLDPPLLMALDEVTQICPVPLPSWLADSGGKGIQIITACQLGALHFGQGQPRARAAGGVAAAAQVEDDGGRDDRAPRCPAGLGQPVHHAISCGEAERAAAAENDRAPTNAIWWSHRGRRDAASCR